MNTTRYSASCMVTLLLAIGQSFGQAPGPQIHLQFNESGGLTAANTGIASASFVRTASTPVSSTNVPTGVGGANAIDFGTAPGNYYVESTGVIDALKNLSAFTLTGWINNTSNAVGSGGNRIISWINNGGEGVDLVYQSNGSLRLGVDGWPDYSPAFSSAGKVPTNAAAPASNWVFFAVTYQSNGQVSFYFGNNTTDASLDVTRSYPAPGVTGSAINRLAIGAFNIGTRNSGTWDRMFRGLIDDIQIYESVLSGPNIVAVQRTSRPSTLPDPWVSQDIGNVGVAGTAKYSRGIFTIEGSGTDIGNTSDEFRYTYRALNGDGELSARVLSIENVNSQSKAGIMIRETLTGGSKHALVNITPIPQFQFSWRTNTNGPTSATLGSTGGDPWYWVKLRRIGNVITAFESKDGMTWTQVGTPQTITMAPNVYIGLAVSSKNNAELNTSVFDGVGFRDGDIIPPSPPTNLTSSAKTNTSVNLGWGAATDNVAIAGYSIYNGNTLCCSSTGLSFNVTGLTPNTSYSFTVIARDAAGNVSGPSNALIVTTNNNNIGSPIIHLNLDGAAGANFSNSGSAPANFVRPANVPAGSTNVPAGVGGERSADFWPTPPEYPQVTLPGNYYIESTAPVDALKNLSALTITGWVNNKSNVAGSGGNRIVSWINHGGEGVDLVYNSDGSLQLGVDGWPDGSPARSSVSKIPTNTAAPSSNWTFFAVTYQSNGQVQFYFGNTAQDALLDVTRSYPGRGVTGANIGKLAIGAFNDATRNAGTYNRLFRGLIDDVYVYGLVLTPQEIVQVQRTSNAASARVMTSARQAIIVDEQVIKPELHQNFPNPYSTDTEIGLALPRSVRRARIVVIDVTGRSLKDIEVVERGETSIILDGNDLSSGMYFYRLVVDGKLIDMKRMAITR